MAQETTHILQAAWVTDAAYAHATEISIFSASQKTPADAVFIIVMPPGDMAQANWDLLRSVLRPNHALRLVAAADPRIAACGITSAYISNASYLRFLLPDVLPDLDRCIYIDADMLVLEDLSCLWQELDPDAPVCAARDLHVNAEGSYVQSLGLTSYFNSGLLGLNLRAWRANGYADKCLNLAASANPPFKYQDQDVLNLVFAGRVKWLAPRWNIMTNITGYYAQDATFVSKAEWQQLLARPGIAHFTGARKPWQGEMLHYWSWQYWQVAAHSPWRSRYATQRACARRRYLVRRFKYWRRWRFRSART